MLFAILNPMKSSYQKAIYSLPMKKIILYASLILITGCTNPVKNDPVELVNPFIGTAGHGHTYPGAVLPFGMVQLSPDTRKDNWDACSGYHYSDTVIHGFSHTHLSGTGVGDYGDIRFMPMTGEMRFTPGDGNKKGYSSRFTHKKEEASPGYYRVFLEDPGIDAEFTVTSRCGLHQYTFPSADEANILIDLTESVVTESNLELSVQVLNDHEICGYRKSSGWAEKQGVYFHAVFSKPFLASGIVKNGIIMPDSASGNGNDIKAFVKYRTNNKDKILVKVGISGVSEEGARRNLEAEIPGWDFNQVRQKAESVWREELSRIEIKGGRKEDRIKFYTALYHCYLAPNLFSDIDGQYRGHDLKIHKADGYSIYTVFSLWDTYRALHPLMTIIQQKRTSDFIRTFLDIYEQGGLLPVWELAGNETFCMIGYHAVPVIADAYIKGIKGYDPEKAFQAMLNSATQDHFGLNYYRESGYIPAEAEGESVSKTLEYAYDDWCISILAERMGKTNEFRSFTERAQYYKNIFDPDTRFLRGKRNGMFTEPFDPAEVNFMLTEANSWQYTFYVPQDIAGLKDLMGGDEGFENKLDEMFSSPQELKGRQQADITGLIGQYAHGNEPSHHMAYLYNYVGRPDKTQKLVRQIMSELYGAGPDGLCGNEDCGQMSAWFVLSAMGFYPVTPGSGDYVIGSPLFNEIKIHAENGNEFIIRCDRNSDDNIYIQSASLNGTEYKKAYISHQDMMNGGVLELEMTSEPGNEWGTRQEERPKSAITDHLILPVPFFAAASSSFQEELPLKIRHIDPNAEIYYRTQSEDISKPDYLYEKPLLVEENEIFSAYAVKNSQMISKIARASYYKIHNDWKISVKNPYSSQYTGGGEMGLADGQKGGTNFRTGSWQGYQGCDFEATIDMGDMTKIKGISVTFLQDQRSWIFMPEKVEFLISGDGSNFRSIAEIGNDTDEKLPDAVIQAFTKSDLKLEGRYIKVFAKNRGICPDWHVGAGDKAWIFVDEITIE